MLIKVRIEMVGKTFDWVLDSLNLNKYVKNYGKVH